MGRVIHCERLAVPIRIVISPLVLPEAIYIDLDHPGFALPAEHFVIYGIVAVEDERFDNQLRTERPVISLPVKMVEVEVEPASDPIEIDQFTTPPKGHLPGCMSRLDYATIRI